MENALLLIIAIFIITLLVISDFYNQNQKLHKRILELEFIASECSKEAAKWHDEYQKAKNMDESTIIQELRKENLEYIDELIRLNNEIDQLKNREISSL